VLSPVTDLPDWLQPLARAVDGVTPEELTRIPTPAAGARASAVLALFGEGPDGPDLLFIERASTLRSHAGQPAFPGGAIDPTDDGPVDAALREAEEEVGLDRAGVVPFAVLPGLYLPPSGFLVECVLAWWREPADVGPVDLGEVAAVERIPIRDLVDPANRCEVHLMSGLSGPGFTVGQLLVWGFTGGLVDKILELGGWARPWGPGPFVPRPAAPRPLNEEIPR
jgi:8-oxo-dGTP pyrophosphatase MutT (NUDIX family)